ncbi:hypothetical protein [Nannocystis exedens]|uniref:hypothetical protein n=1 Tax=Nannocystis exedens TaxID=54 RepID=UPI0011606B31|nr:hypothetical protein [Nannocystis exedens]
MLVKSMVMTLLCEFFWKKWSFVRIAAIAESPGATIDGHVGADRRGQTSAARRGHRPSRAAGPTAVGATRRRSAGAGTTAARDVDVDVASGRAREAAVTS